MTNDIHDRAIHSQGREMCLALATICECCSQWDGARTLRHAAEYLYREKYRALDAQIDGMNMVIYALVTRDFQPTFKEEKDEQQ